MGSVSIDLSLANIWASWQMFQQGKKRTSELEHFQFYLEKNLRQLNFDLQSGKYQHGRYRKFIVNDNKRREISVAGVRDRVVHRLIYEYLVKIYDQTFIFDVWSCRKKKGLVGAIERAQKFLKKYPRSFIWRSDIKKFFDSVNHAILIGIINFRVKDEKARQILKKIIRSYPTGIPIGNLTSQIFANIYLNELDRFIKHPIRPEAYLRYGDDFIVFGKNREKLVLLKEQIIRFLEKELALEINLKNDIIVKAKQGLKFLGVEIFPSGRGLNKRNWERVENLLNKKNIASYSGLVRQDSRYKKIEYYNWIIFQKFQDEI